MGKRTHTQTPSQTVGPFFHNALVSKYCNILVNEQTRGQRIRISGKVLDGEGVPIPDALVEIWHGDRNGIYPHPHDPRVGDLDEDFRGFGRAATDDEGLYWFDTIKPGATSSDTDSGQAPFRCSSIRSWPSDPRGNAHVLRGRSERPRPSAKSSFS